MNEKTNDRDKQAAEEARERIYGDIEGNHLEGRMHEFVVEAFLRGAEYARRSPPPATAKKLRQARINIGSTEAAGVKTVGMFAELLALDRAFIAEWPGPATPPPGDGPGHA